MFLDMRAAAGTAVEERDRLSGQLEALITILAHRDFILLEPMECNEWRGVGIEEVAGMYLSRVYFISSKEDLWH